MVDKVVPRLHEAEGATARAQQKVAALKTELAEVRSRVAAAEQT